MCPAGTLSDDAHGGCVLPAQLEDCEQHPDGDDCAIGNDQRPGVCGVQSDGAIAAATRD